MNQLTWLTLGGIQVSGAVNKCNNYSTLGTSFQNYLLVIFDKIISQNIEIVWLLKSKEDERIAGSFASFCLWFKLFIDMKYFVLTPQLMPKN